MDYTHFNNDTRFIIDDASLQDWLVKAERCFATRDGDLYLLDILVDGKEARYVTQSEQRFHDLCIFLGGRDIHISNGNGHATFVVMIVVATLVIAIISHILG